jgi:hypothetical protein
MAVYNPPGQVLFDPITNYYQGKAIRQQLEAGDADLELKKKTLEQADDKLDLEKRRVASQEAQIEETKKRTELMAKEYTAKVGVQRATDEANEIIGIMEGAKASDDPIGYANEKLIGFINNLPEGKDKDILLEATADGLQAPEIEQMYAQAMAVKGQFLSEDKDTTKVVSEGGMLVDAEGNVLVKNPKTPKEPKKDTVKPLTTPTRIEEDIIATSVDKMLVEKIDQKTFSGEFEISEKEKDKVEGWVGEAAKAIMIFEAARGNAMGMNSAASRAAEYASRFLTSKEEPGFFFDAELSFNPPQHLIGQHVDVDGKIYVVEDYADDGEPMVTPID